MSEIIHVRIHTYVYAYIDVYTIHPANADKSEGGGSSKHLIFDHFRLNRCRGCIPEVRGFLTD